MINNKQLREITKRRVSESGLKPMPFAQKIGFNAERLRYFLIGGDLDFAKFIELCKALDISPNGCDAVTITPAYDQRENILKIINSDKNLNKRQTDFLCRIFLENYRIFTDFERTKGSESNK